MKKSILILIAVFSLTNIQAQTLWDRMATAFAEKEVIIVVMEEHEKALKRYKKPEGKIFYKTCISNYNAYMKEMAPKYITYFKGVKFKTVAEIAVMSLEDRKNHFYMCYTINGASTGNLFAIIKKGEEDDFFFRFYIPLKGMHHGGIQIRGQDLKNKRKGSSVIVSKNFPDLAPTRLSLTFALSNLKCYFDKPEVHPLLPSLKEKTLLICRDYLHKKLMAADAIKKLYRYNFEVLPREDFVKAIESKDEKYCYIISTPTSLGEYMAEVIDNATGCSMTLLMPAKDLITGGILKKLQERIK